VEGEMDCGGKEEPATFGRKKEESGPQGEELAQGKEREFLLLFLFQTQTQPIEFK
jgi:hypothetical protein